MRTQTVLLWICLSLVVGLSACDWTSSSPVASLRRATGWPFEVVVVMDRDAWNGEVGELLQEQLRAPIPALPQAEASMRVTYSEPSGFSGLLRYVRNILIVSVDTNRYTKAGTRESPDEWASGQNVVTLYAPTTAALTEFLLLNEGRFVSHALLDKKKGRVIVAESFVYAPESKKANLIRRMEAALFTLRFVD